MAYLVNHPKTVREYETVFILRSDVLDEDRNKVLTRMSNIIEKLDGHILMQEEWATITRPSPTKSFFIF